MSVNLSSLSFKSDSSVSYSFRYLEPAAQERQPQKKLSRLPGLSSWILDFSHTIICFRNVSLLQCRVPVFAEKILIWCRRWWKSFVFLPRDVSSQSCQKLPFHVKLLPRGSLSNLMFKLYIVQLRDKYLKMITLLIDQNWLWIKFPRASLISEFLGNIFVGIWAQNWIWSKNFPLLNFLWQPFDGSMASGLVSKQRILQLFSLSHKLKPQSLTWPWLLDRGQMRFIEVEHCLDKWVRWISDER